MVNYDIFIIGDIMKNKGFTLIELLGVIVILGIMALIVFPPIINQMKNLRASVSSATQKLIFSATDKYMANNRNTYPRKEDISYCITLQQLVNGGVISSPIKDAETGEEISLDHEVLVDLGASYSATYDLVETGGCGYIDPTGAKAPELTANMIPIVRSDDNTKWLKADVKSEWYNYGDAKWANAVLVTNSSRAYYKRVEVGTEIAESDVLMYYVWVPRYRYKIFNAPAIAKTIQKIEIIFEGKRTTESDGDANGEWLTHPAFDFGSLKLNGLWIGKYETAYSGATSAASAEKSIPEEHKAIIKPNSYSWRSITVFNMFTVSNELTKNGNKYGLNTTSDTHMIKNTEWGAIAYLTTSDYGKYGNPTYTNASGLEKELWINNSSTYVTGCAGSSINDSLYAGCESAFSSTNGVKASTTGNVYGIYDMSGGALDYVMAAPYNTGNTTVAISSTGFSQVVIDGASMIKYVDKYLYGTSYNDQNAYNRRILGDATGETRGWNGDRAFMTYSGNWLTRGGHADYYAEAGIFSSAPTTGAAGLRLAFRVTLIPLV